jgi:hypothetical protein
LATPKVIITRSHLTQLLEAISLGECFIDGMFVVAKKGVSEWERPSGAGRLTALHSVDYHNSTAHVEESADAWKQYDERGSPENLAA